ncbi:beta-lactamase-like protein 2 homolog isoform X1 [Vespa mandarinia]|uniref:beta-lactamase-like protein 2 homolog isoform X1 n=2 Tax=Vespa mandarinia TaxID=7446 RepID=UPI00160BE360|nr:beta-lactamase-like protein 2 homolog isoform X1 [Vespa mandarinia]
MVIKNCNVVFYLALESKLSINVISPRSADFRVELSSTYGSLQVTISLWRYLFIFCPYLSLKSHTPQRSFNAIECKRKMTMRLTSLPLVSKISNKIIRILGCNPGPMTLQGTNTYLIGSGTRRVLIDTGDIETSAEYIKLLKNVLIEENATIEHVIITHWHHDHIGGINSVQELLMTTKPNDNPPTIWKLPTYEKLQVTPDLLKQCKSLKDEQIIEVEGTKIQVKHTPGHTTDHVCLLLKDEHSLFSGDCILGEGTAVFEDLHDYMISLQKILDIKPSVIYPGHGPIIKDPVPRIEYYIQHRKQREEQILNVLKENSNSSFMSEMDIVQIIYKDTPKNLWPAAAHNVMHHLQKLLKETKVVGKEGEWKISENIKFDT